MPLIRRTCAAALLMPMLAVSAHAQVSRLPMEVQEVLAALGPKWGTALRENIDATAAAFRPAQGCAQGWRHRRQESRLWRGCQADP
jgi:hypothetical protein